MGLNLTAAQAVIFDQFFQVTTAGGALAFTWQNPRTGNPATFRFVGTPVLQPLRNRVGGAYVATFSLEQLPPLDGTGTFMPGGSGGGDPGDPVPTHVVSGTLGDFTFAEDSQIRLLLRCWCQTTPGFVYGDPTDATLELDFFRVTPGTIDWRFDDGSANTTVGFSADQGWYQNISDQHWVVPSACSGFVVTPSPLLNEFEHFPIFRNYSYPEVVGGNAAVLCLAGQVAAGFGKLTDATLLPGSVAAPSARASGFRTYDAVCVSGS